MCAIPLWLMDRVFCGFFLGRLIRFELARFKPDLLHLNETQGAGYAFLAGNLLPNPKMTTLLTLYGSDLYWFRQFDKHLKKLKRLLPLLDQLSCECERDQKLALELGFRGKFMPIVPAFGGVNLVRKISNNSARRTIAIKGYQNKWGQALVALKALREAQDCLAGYRVVVYSSSWRTSIAAWHMLATTKINLTVHKKGSLAHEKVLSLFRESIIYIGLSKSDGISASMIEAMSQGAVPIQSRTSCCDEWIEDQVGGFLVDYDDSSEIARLVREILSDPNIVRRAQKSNFKALNSTLNDSDTHRKIKQTYGI